MAQKVEVVDTATFNQEEFEELHDLIIKEEKNSEVSFEEFCRKIPMEQRQKLMEEAVMRVFYKYMVTKNKARHLEDAEEEEDNDDNLNDLINDLDETIGHEPSKSEPEPSKVKKVKSKPKDPEPEPEPKAVKTKTKTKAKVESESEPEPEPKSKSKTKTKEKAKVKDGICKGVKADGDPCSFKAHENGYCGRHDPDKDKASKASSGSKGSKPRTKKEVHECHGIMSKDKKQCTSQGTIKPDNASFWYCKRHSEKWTEYESEDAEELQESDE